MSIVGIDSIAFYVPKLYVPIEALAKERGIAPEKLQKGLGLHKMAVPDVGEDAASFAANALLKLIRQNQLNPNDLGRVYLGTESAVDGSKPTATYAVEIVENELTNTYGERSFKHCDILDMTFACVGAVDALHNSVDWVRQNPNRKAVVIASDLSKYDLNSTGEYTQGAGAVAVLITHEPAILEIQDTWGIASKSEGDFFKPRRSFKKADILSAIINAMSSDSSPEQLNELMVNSESSFWSDPSEIVEVFKEEPIFDGQFSNTCYEDRITEALEHFIMQQPTDLLNKWSKYVFHLPYAYHGRRIIFSNWLKWLSNTALLQVLEAEIGKRDDLDLKDWTKQAYKSSLYADFIKNKIADGELASSEIGNMYTASIFMSFLSILCNSYKNSEALANTTFGFIAYGSGSKSKVFEGRINEQWRSKIEGLDLFEELAQRQAISISTYEDLHRNRLEQPVSDDSKIQLAYIETDSTNYGLRRYEIK